MYPKKNYLITLRLFMDVKAKYFLETKKRGVEKERRRLEDIERGMETVSLEMKVILCIKGLQRSFSGAHGDPAFSTPYFFLKN